MHMGEGPDNSFKRQTPGDLRVFEHIIVIIIINERVAKRLAKDQPRNGGQENTNAEGDPKAVQTSGSVSGFERRKSAAMCRRCAL